MRPFARSRHAVLCAIVCFLPLGTASASQNLIGLYTAWRGGSAFLALHSLIEHGTFSDGGLSGSGTLAMDFAGDTRQDWNFASLHTTLTLNHNQGSYTNLSGQRLPLSAAETDYARADALALMPAAFAAGAAKKPDLERDGKTWRVLEVREGRAATEDFLISPVDGALHGLLVRRNGATETITFADWRVVDGVRIPFDVNEQGFGGIGAIADDNTEFKVASAALNDVPAGSFAPPPAKRLASYADGRSSGWIRFQLIDDLIYLPVAINGHPAEAVLDSGAGNSVLDSTYARSIDVNAVGGFTVLGQGGSAGSAYAPNLKVSAGGLTLNGVTAILTDLRPLGSFMTRPLTVIMGAEAFTECAVDIDYLKQRVRFLKPDILPPADQPATEVLPLTTYAGSFTTLVSPEGRQAVPVILDTGNDGSFQLFPNFWQPSKLLEGRQSTVVRGGGIGGLVDNRLASLKALGFGTVQLHDVPTVFEAHGVPVTDQTDILGNLGDVALSHFHAILDFPDGKLMLSSNAKTDLPFERDLLGLELQPDGAMRKVMFVMPGSPAATSGFKAGDVIKAVRGYALGPVARPEWEKGNPGQSVIITLADGRTRTLVKQRFY